MRLSHGILSLDSDPADQPGRIGVGDWLLHQHRVTLTYRVCNPSGTLGMVLTHGVTWGLLFAVCNPESSVAWGVAAVVLIVRLLTAWANARTLDFPREKRGLEFAALVLAASIAESVFWLISWLPLPVRWGARTFQVGQGGQIGAGVNAGT